MKRLSIIFISAAIMLSAAFSASAQQNLRSAYFLDGYTYGYRFNPAFQGERGFFAIPVLGKFGVGMESNLGLSTFLYPGSDGNLTTFLSPTVSDQEFLNKVKPANRFMLNADLQLFALGFRTGKMYHTLDVSMRSDVSMNLPGDLLTFMKIGSAHGQTAWDISNIGARMEMRTEIAYGISRCFGENLNVGARFKVLMGAAKLDIGMKNMNLKMSEEEWAVNAKGAGMIAGPVTVRTLGETGSATEATQTDVVDWSSLEFPDSAEEFMAYLKKPALGFAVDLGASYTILDYITVSASILDLGRMSWKNVTTLQTPETAWSFNGFEDVSMTGQGNGISDQLEGIADELLNSFNLQKEGFAEKKASGLACTLHAGVEAKLPFYERLSLGVLATHRFDGAYSWTEGRFALNWAPARWFAMTGNYAISDFGSSLGAAMNIHLPGITLFAGLDSFLPLSNVTPDYYIPVDNLNTNLTFGLNIAFGKYNGQFPKDE